MTTTTTPKPFRIRRNGNTRPVYYATEAARDAGARRWAAASGAAVAVDVWNADQGGVWTCAGTVGPPKPAAGQLPGIVRDVLGEDVAHVAGVLFGKHQESKDGTFYTTGVVYYTDGRPAADAYFDAAHEVFSSVYGSVGWHDGLVVVPGSREIWRGTHIAMRDQLASRCAPATDVTYSAAWTPSEDRVTVVRDVRAGVCGPFDEFEATSTEDAVKVLRARGYLVTGEWKISSLGDHWAPLTRLP